MNASMSIRIRPACAGLLIAACSAAQTAAAEPPLLPAVKAVLYTVDCVDRAPPSQREVGDWTGQYNLGQVYDTRERLMGDVARACQRPGVGAVQLVRDAGSPPEDGRAIAVVALSGG